MPVRPKVLAFDTVMPTPCSWMGPTFLHGVMRAPRMTVPLIKDALQRTLRSSTGIELLRVHSRASPIRGPAGPRPRCVIWCHVASGSMSPLLVSFPVSLKQGLERRLPECAILRLNSGHGCEHSVRANGRWPIWRAGPSRVPGDAERRMRSFKAKGGAHWELLGRSGLFCSLWITFPTAPGKTDQG